MSYTYTQSDPPNFGKAKFIPKFIFNLIVKIRKKKSEKIINNIKYNSEIRVDTITILILSCKRLGSLKRLISSIKPFFKNIDTFKKVEFVLVDNGSNKELLEWCRSTNFFTRIIHFKKNLGMCEALNSAYKEINSEFILLLEDDFVIDYQKPFLKNCINIFREYPEIGIIRLKNQNNWGKKHRIIGPIRKTKNDTKFWTWLPSLNGKLNVWAAGSVMFRKISYLHLGEIHCSLNFSRSQNKHQGVYYEEIYGKKFNKIWLAAKIKNCYPFVQLERDSESPGWGEF